MEKKVELGLYDEGADLFLELTLPASRWAEIQDGKQLLEEVEEFFAEDNCSDEREIHSTKWVFNRNAAAESLTIECPHCGFCAYEGSWADVTVSGR